MSELMFCHNQSKLFIVFCIRKGVQTLCLIVLFFSFFHVYGGNMNTNPNLVIKEISVEQLIDSLKHDQGGVLELEDYIITTKINSINSVSLKIDDNSIIIQNLTVKRYVIMRNCTFKVYLNGIRYYPLKRVVLRKNTFDFPVVLDNVKIPLGHMIVIEDCQFQSNLVVGCDNSIYQMNRIGIAKMLEIKDCENTSGYSVLGFTQCNLSRIQINQCKDVFIKFQSCNLGDGSTSPAISLFCATLSLLSINQCNFLGHIFFEGVSITSTLFMDFEVEKGIDFYIKAKNCSFPDKNTYIPFDLIDDGDIRISYTDVKLGFERQIHLNNMFSDSILTSNGVSSDNIKIEPFFHAFNTFYGMLYSAYKNNSNYDNAAKCWVEKKKLEEAYYFYNKDYGDWLHNRFWGLTTGYGTNYWTTLLFIVVETIFFFLIYLGLTIKINHNQGSDQINREIVWSTFLMSFSISFLAFDLTSIKKDNLLRVWGVFHFVVALILITLFSSVIIFRLSF